MHLMGQIMRDEGRHQVKVEGVWLRGELPYILKYEQCGFIMQ